MDVIEGRILYLIFDWMENDSLLRIDQVLNVIYELRMCTKQQLLTVTGLQLENLNQILKNIRKLPVDNKGDWLNMVGIGIPKKKGDSIYVYSLGRKAIQHVQLMRGMELRNREAPSAQMSHFIGINAVLERAIKQFGRQRIKWYAEIELADLLYLQIREKEGQDPQRRSIIRPDGLIDINGKSYFIEFDNSTEGARQLENKFARYIELYDTLDFKHPIVWVANTEKRINYLQRNWRASVDNFYSHKSNLPVCIFSVAGREFESTNRKIPISF